MSLIFQEAQEIVHSPSSSKCQIMGKSLKVLLHNPKKGENFKSRIKFKILHCHCPPTAWVQHAQKVPSWAQAVTSFAAQLFWSIHAASIVMCITLGSFHVPFEHTETLTLEMGVPVPPFIPKHTCHTCLKVSLKAPCWGTGWSPSWVTGWRGPQNRSLKHHILKKGRRVCRLQQTPLLLFIPLYTNACGGSENLEAHPRRESSTQTHSDLLAFPSCPCCMWRAPDLTGFRCLSFASLYLPVAMSSFTFACYVIIKLTHLKLKAELPDYPPAHTESLWTQENPKLWENYSPGRPVTKMTVDET